jgi:hypothetical protein
LAGGWTRQEQRPVWARRNAAIFTCPKTLLSGEIAAWLEAFAAWKRLGYPNVLRLPARDVDAMLALEEELASEVMRGQE